jgi:hypothetical protein
MKCNNSFGLLVCACMHVCLCGVTGMDEQGYRSCRICKLYTLYKKSLEFPLNFQWVLQDKNYNIKLSKCIFFC